MDINDITDEHGSINIKNTMPKSICCYNKEIIKVNNRIIEYPHDTIAIKKSDISHYHKKSLINLEYIMPPIIINLRHDALPHERNTRELLSHMEIDYFKQKGNNALIFIHGFNLKYGKFGSQIEKAGLIADSLPYPVTSSSDRTLYRNLEMIQKRFGNIEPYHYSQNSSLNLDPWLNGYDAHNWFVHMEDNLNRATQQFDRTNYCSFTRNINVAWSSDLLPIKYMAAEKPADQAGKDLVPLILQLHQHNIHINIIAHSLGCRVLLSLMHQLGLLGKDNILDHVILWQAATPANVFTDNPDQDYSVKKDWQYFRAYRASCKVTILYSQHDWVLWIAYALANDLGIEPTFKTNKWKIVGQYLKSRRQKEFHELLNQSEHLFSTDSALQLLNNGNDASQSSLEIEKLRMMVMKMQQRISRQHRIRQALGYAGPDAYTRKLLKHKLIAVEQAALKGHSAMKIPSQQVMQSIYQQYIIGGRHGIRRFGTYKL
ncbi:MAG: alpha/beta hydrolase [Gammaproteobacteria bacterium]|nr:alpha/beta hydrolase [Gammaproteobacteria bacterium]